MLFGQYAIEYIINSYTPFCILCSVHLSDNNKTATEQWLGCKIERGEPPFPTHLFPILITQLGSHTWDLGGLMACGTRSPVWKKNLTKIQGI